MSGLLSFEVFDEGGEELFAETVPHDLAAIESLEKDIFVGSQRLTIRISFDPPVQCPAAEAIGDI